MTYHHRRTCLLAALVAASLALWSPLGLAGGKGKKGKGKKGKDKGAQVEGTGEGGEPDEVTKQAIYHFKKGVKFFKKHKYKAAVAEFLKSYELKPNWAIRYNIGVCYKETDRPLEALEQLKAYLEEGGEKIPEERRTEVEDHIAELEGMLGLLDVSVTEDGATVIVDEYSKYETPLEDPIPLMSGIHGIEVTKTGFETFRTEVVLASGDRKTVEVELVPLEGWKTDDDEEEETPEPVEPLPPEKPPLELRGIWILLGAGGGLAVLAGVAGGLVLSYKGKMDDAADACEVTLTRDDCPKAYGYQDKVDGWKIATNVLVGAAGAAAIAGLVVFLVDLKKRGSAEKEDGEDVIEVGILPMLLPGAAGIATELRF